MVSRAFHSVISTDLARARDWYISLFGYEVSFDSDWFVHLQHPDESTLELGFLARDHEIVTDAMRAAPAGGIVTIVVDDVDDLHEEAVSRGIEILEEPNDLFYGQRRMIIADPDGQLLDVNSECPPDPAWIATLST